jgi:hypothetical protein
MLRQCGKGLHSRLECTKARARHNCDTQPVLHECQGSRRKRQSRLPQKGQGRGGVVVFFMARFCNYLQHGEPFIYEAFSNGAKLTHYETD